jgi:hypothetical protein
MNLIESIRAQRVIGLLILGGIAMMVLSLLFWLMFAGAGAGQATQGNFAWYFLRFIPLLGVVAGLVMCIGGVMFGLVKSQDTYHSARETTHEGVYIVGKFAEGPDAMHVFDPEEADPDETTFYVQVALVDGSRVEYKTTQMVFMAVGEGSRAVIQVKGNWMLGYQMIPAPPRA